MKKQLLNMIALSVIATSVSAQILYSERFNAVSPINTYTYSTTSGVATLRYGDIPMGMTAINVGNKTAATVGSSGGAVNRPFSVPGQNQKAWLAYAPGTNPTDTFAVSTSWLTPSGITDMWMITPIINNIAVSTILSWEELAPDSDFPDGYKVYVTTNTVNAVPAVADFTAAPVFSTTAAGSTWFELKAVSLAAYAGQSIRIAFRNNSNDQNQLWIDDIVVQNLASSKDIALVSNDTYKYSNIGSNNTIGATIKNLGYSAVTSLVMNYKVGTNPTVTQTLAISPSVSYPSTKSITFTTPFNTSTVGYNDVKIWVSAVNGGADQVNTNDTVIGPLTINASVPAKKVLAEEFTGAWCGYCPDGYSILRDVSASNPNVIPVALHDNDAMSTTETNAIIADYADGFPSAVIDQYYFKSYGSVGISRGSWANYITQRLAMTVPATVSVSAVSYNSTNRQISATVNTTFVGEVKGDYRLNLYVIENNVCGSLSDLTDNNWNQHSYFYNDANSEWYHAGTLGIVSAGTALIYPAQYKHQHVVLKAVGSAFGTASIIPTTGGTQGQTYSKTYTYTLPAASANISRYNPDNIYLVGLVSEYNTSTFKRAVLNATEVKLNTNPEVAIGINENYSETISSRIYPNPAINSTSIAFDLKNSTEVTVRVFNILGENVLTQTASMPAGENALRLNTSDLSSGTYNVIVSTKESSTTHKLSIVK